MAKNAISSKPKNSPSKTDKKKAKELTKKNLEKVIEEVKEEQKIEAPARELKYIYPANIVTQPEKKDFRRKLRAAHASHEKAIRVAKKDRTPEGQEKYLEKKAAFDKFLQAHYSIGKSIMQPSEN